MTQEKGYLEALKHSSGAGVPGADFHGVNVDDAGEGLPGVPEAFL